MSICIGTGTLIMSRRIIMAAKIVLLRIFSLLLTIRGWVGYVIIGLYRNILSI